MDQKKLFTKVGMIIMALVMTVGMTTGVSFAKSKNNNPGKVTGLKLTYSKGENLKTTIKWNKNKKANGYEVTYSEGLSSKFNKLFTGNKTSVSTNKFYRGCEYKIRLRAYKTVKKKKVFGPYLTKAITTPVLPQKEPDNVDLSETLAATIGLQYGEGYAVAENGTLKLLKDIALPDGTMLPLQKGRLTVDFNGHILSCKEENPTGDMGKGAVIKLGDSLEVTLTDSVGSGGITATGKNSKCIIIGGDATLNIKGGNYKSESYGIYNSSSVELKTVNIMGGTFDSSINVNGCNLNISGGTFNAHVSPVHNDNVVVSGGVFNNGLWSEGGSPSTIKIKGGEFYGVRALYINSIEYKNLEISGGKFEANQAYSWEEQEAVFLVSDGYNNSEGDNILKNVKITGGEFIADQTDTAFAINTGKYNEKSALKAMIPSGYHAEYEKSDVKNSSNPGNHIPVLYFGPVFKVVKG